MHRGARWNDSLAQETGIRMVRWNSQGSSAALCLCGSKHFCSSYLPTWTDFHAWSWSHLTLVWRCHTLCGWLSSIQLPFFSNCTRSQSWLQRFRSDDKIYFPVPHSIPQYANITYKQIEFFDPTHISIVFFHGSGHGNIETPLLVFTLHFTVPVLCPGYAVVSTVTHLLSLHTT